MTHHPDYAALSEQAATAHQDANARFQQARADSETAALRELVFTAASYGVTRLLLEPSDQGPHMIVSEIEPDVEGQAEDIIGDSGSYDLSDYHHADWLAEKGVTADEVDHHDEQVRKATIDVKSAVKAMLMQDVVDESIASEKDKPLTHVDFARQWIEADDSPDADSDSLYTEARWEFERVIKENERLPLFAHFDEVCQEAGLGVMVQVYEIISDRGDVEESTLLALTAEDVENHYFRIGAGIDDVERSLRAKEEDSLLIRKHDGN